MILKGVKTMQNCFSIDFLTINVKNISSEELLILLCDSVSNKDLSVENFAFREFGGMRGYSRSYAFLNEDFIRLSFHPEHPDFGVSIQLTGQGCKYLTEKDFINLVLAIRHKEKPYSITRLDIAYDDFNRIIPLEQMYQAVDNFIDYNTSISTKINRTSLQFYNGMFNNIRYKNFEIGTRTSTGRVRLYDKRAEQKIDELDYWYRLELELRQEKSQAFIDLFVDGTSLSDLYISALNSILRFIDDRYEGINARSNCPNAIWYDEFLVELGNCSSKSIFRE